MIKVFNATDKNYATHGDLILQPSKAVVHKEDNGEFYLDLETPLNEKEHKNTTPEAGQTAEGTSFSITTDLTKQYQVQTLKGQTSQSSTPTPSSPIPINITTGRQVVSVCGKNLFNKNTITSITNGTISNDVITSNAISSDYGGVSANITNFKLQTGTYYVSMKVKLESGTVRNNLNTITFSSSPSITKTIISNPNLSNEYQIYSASIVCSSETSITNIGIQLKNQNSNAVISYTDIMISKDSNTTYEEYKGNDYEINLGKNLANIDDIQIGKSWSNVANTNRATILFIPVIAGQQYSLVSSYTNENITQIRGVLNKGANDQVSSLVVNGTFTVASGWSYISIEVIANTTFTSSMLDGVKIMLCKGTATINDYAPYKNPIYLGEMRNTNNVVIAEDYIKKNTGVNLLNEEFTQMSANAIKCELLNFPSGTYTWSFSNNTLPGEIQVKTKVNGTYQTYVNAYSTKQLTFTLDTSQDIQLESYKAGGNPLSNYSNMMINEGTTALPYEPYGEGQWYIHKEIGRVVLNGSEEWIGMWRSNNPVRYSWRTAISNALYPTDASQYLEVLSNYYKSYTQTSLFHDSSYSDYNSSGICIRANNSEVLIKNDNITTSTDATTANNAFKTWLSTHNVEVYYVLNTPTNTLIEDEELINQLNAIELLEGLNNVSVSSANLPAILQLKYNFTTAYSNTIKYIDYLVPNNILVANTPQGDQAFRITNIEKTRRKIKLKANHVFYDTMNYLIADSYVVDKNCNDALDHLNNATSDLSPFTTISNITSINSYRCVRKSLYEAIQVVLERWGGHLVRNDWTLGIYDTIGQDNGVTIRYAKNLKDISATYDWNNVVTKLLPVGKDGLLLNETDPDASIYVESATQYDIPYTKTVSFDQNNIVEDNYKDEDGVLDEEAYKQALVDDLYSKAMEYITNNYLPKVNYKLAANVEKVSDVGDRVEVIDEKLGINLMTNIISFDYDCILERYTQIEFGNFTPTLSNLMTQISVHTEEQINASTQTLQVTLNQELTDATDKIWNALGNSYVIYEGDKILVVDTLPKEEATNVIMINNGGIAFSNSGIDGTFSSAWTIDNVLNMEQINVINLTADLIKGGTLKLGSNLNQTGRLEVFDEANTLIAELNKDGLKMYGADGSYVLMNNQVGFSGYDRNDNKIYWVDKDVFHQKKSEVEEEITLVKKMRIIPITIRDNNNQIVNDGIGFVNVGGGV